MIIGVDFVDLDFFISLRLHNVIENSLRLHNIIESKIKNFIFFYCVYKDMRHNVLYRVQKREKYIKTRDWDFIL